MATQHATNSAPDAQPPAASAWLDALAGVLAPLAPLRLDVLDAALASDMAWVDPAPDAQVLARSSGAAVAPRGWLLRLPDPSGAPRCLFVATAIRRDEDDAALLLGASLVRVAWRLQRLAAAPSSAIIRDETGEAIHSLRNGLNSVLMSSAVLASGALPQTMAGFVSDLESAGRSSVRALNELSLLITPR